MIKHYKSIIFIFFLFLFFFSAYKVYAYPVDPQYILVRKSSGYGTRACGNNDPNFMWNATRPGNYNKQALAEISYSIRNPNAKIPRPTNYQCPNPTPTPIPYPTPPPISDAEAIPVGTDTRQLGVASFFNYNAWDPNWSLPLLKQSLINMLSLSEQTGIPMYIVIDGYQWVEGRPDLWNWFDPSKPGYDWENRKNVEWHCWGPSDQYPLSLDPTKNCAIKKIWRDWGTRIEVAPAPNILSDEFLQISKSALNPLIDYIVTWYNGLPADKKYLFAGLSLVVEQDITSEYYDGDELPPLNEQGFNFSDQVGYAAVKTYKYGFGNIEKQYIDPAIPITDSDITLAVQKYLTELYKYAYDKGIPRNKMYTHTGMWGFRADRPTTLAFAKTEVSVNEYAQPGWSLYNIWAKTPGSFSSLSNAIDRVGKTTWASPEWNIEPYSTQADWENALRNSLNYKNNLFVDVSNWEHFTMYDYDGDPNTVSARGLSAINKVLYETPTCYVRAPEVSAPTVSGNTVTFNWTAGSSLQALTLLVSSSPDMSVLGTLKNPDILQTSVRGSTSYTQTITTPGTYYFQLVADGCNNTNNPMRKISDNGKFTVSAPSSSVDGDATGEGLVNGEDYIIWLDNYGKPVTQGPTQGDFYPIGAPDNHVDGQDYLIWLNNYK